MMKGGQSNAPTYTGISIQTSAQSQPIVIVWGKTRIGTNLLWYGDFTKTPVKQGKGGKGGGKGGAYNYSAAVILALCEGPIQSIGTVWADQDETTLAALGLTLFTGTISQTPWAYLTSRHPTEALAYSQTAYLATDSYALGFAPTLPNHNFEVVGTYSGSMPGTPDANLGDIIPDFFNNAQYGVGPVTIDSTTLAFFKTYQRAQGLFFSPALDNDEQVSQIIDRWAVLSNSWIFWSGGSLKFAPLGDSVITNNGVTYTPDTTIQFALGADDFFTGGEGPPIVIDRLDPADCASRIKVEVKDRENAYNLASVEWKDQALIDKFGRIDAQTTTAHEICDLAVADIVKNLIGQREAFSRKTYSFKLGMELGSGLEPGDLCTIYSPMSGITSATAIRIKQLDEDDRGAWSVTAEAYIDGNGTVYPTSTPSSSGGTVNTNVDPGNVNPPGIFEPNSALTDGVAQVWIAASGGSNWGGASVFISFDNVNYVPIGLITAPAWQGVLTATLSNHADPDTVDTLSVDLTESVGIMETTATHADADAFRTLTLVTDAWTAPSAPVNGEVIAYGAVAQGAGSYSFDLTYLRRGLYGSTIASHASGSYFSRFDLNSVDGIGNTAIVYNLPPAYIGQTIWLKFLSFNSFNKQLQDISTVTAYSYVPKGTGYGPGTGGIPLAPTGFAVTSTTSDSITFAWTSNAATDNVETYELWYASGTSVAFGSTTKIASVTALKFTVPGLTPGTTYTFYLVARNQIGPSAPSTVVNQTTLTINSLVNVTASTSPTTLANATAATVYYNVTNSTGADLEIRMMSAPLIGQVIIIEDVVGTTSTHKWTIKTNNGVTTLDTIQVDHGWTKLQWNGTSWVVPAG